MKLEEIKQGQILFLKSDIEKLHPFTVKRTNKNLIIATIGQDEKEFCIHYYFLTQTKTVKDVEIRTNLYKKGYKATGREIKRNTIILFDNEKGRFYGVVRRLNGGLYETYFIYNGRLVLSVIDKKNIIATLEKGNKILYRYNNNYSL